MFGFVFYDGNVEEAVLEGEDDSIAYLDLVIEFGTIETSNPDFSIFKIKFYIVADSDA